MKILTKTSIAIGFLLTAQIFNACKVSKDLATPDTNLPLTYRGADSSDSVAVVKMPWQALFEDPEQVTLIKDALAHNNDLIVAMKNIEAARLNLQQAKLGNLPEVALSAGASTLRPSDNSLDGLELSQYTGSKHVEDYTVAATFTWEADIWGKIKAKKASALAVYLQTAEARNLLQTQIISDVSKDYYNLLMLDEQLSIAKNNVLLDSSTVVMVQLQYQAGQVTLLAVKQATALRQSAEALVPQFESQVKMQENALSTLSGRLPGDILRNENLDAIKFPEQLGAGVPALILSRRPDVKLAELALVKANADVGYSKALMYPSFAITAQGGLDAINFSNWFVIPASLFGTVAGGITQPLFHHKKLLTAYEVANIHRDQAAIQFSQTVLVAVGEVSDALTAMDKLKRQEYFVNERTTTLIDATARSQQLFNNGLATYLEVITAETNVLQSELELASLKNRRLTAVVDLYRSVGGGWQ